MNEGAEVPGSEPEESVATMSLHMWLNLAGETTGDGPRRWADRFAGPDIGFPLARNQEAEAILSPLLAEVDLSDLDDYVIAKLTQTLSDADTEQLLPESTFDSEEYKQEATLIAALHCVDGLNRDSLWAVFASQFGETKFAQRGLNAWSYLLFWLFIDFKPEYDDERPADDADDGAQGQGRQD